MKMRSESGYILVATTDSSISFSLEQRSANIFWKEPYRKNCKLSGSGSKLEDIYIGISTHRETTAS